MKKSFIINDICWMLFSLFVCIWGLRLGFGSLKEPMAGFMPVLAGLITGLLSIADLLSGLLGAWRGYGEESGWTQTNWPKLFSTIAVLFAYTLLFRPLGFIVDTFLLLLFLVHVMGHRSWLLTVLISALTTCIFYLAFKTCLDCQLPAGLFGF